MSTKYLLSSYSTDMSMLIRYANMLFFLGVIIFTACSRKFKAQVDEVIASIRT